MTYGLAQNDKNPLYRASSKCVGQVFFYNLQQLQPIFVTFGTEHPEYHSF